MHGDVLHMLGHLREVWPLLLFAMLVTTTFRIAIGGLLGYVIPPDSLRRKRPRFFSGLRATCSGILKKRQGRTMAILHLLIGGFVFCVLFLLGSVYFLFLALLRRFTGDGKPLPKWKRGIRTLCYALSILLLLCGVWSFIEPYYPQIRNIEIRSNKIHTPITLVQISDLHCDKKQRAEPRVVATIKEIKPDLVLFTGDGINSLDALPNFLSTIREISDTAPVYGVRGNWEMWWFAQTDIFTESNMTDMANRTLTLDIRGNRLTLCGSEVDNEERSFEAIKSLNRKDYNIFLHHYPAAWRLADGYADLHLSGDTHGGQVRIPLIGPLVKMKRMDKVFYDDGLQKPGDILLYVNHGIGMEGGSAPRVRINCPPEITVFNLLPEE